MAVGKLVLFFVGCECVINLPGCANYLIADLFRITRPHYYYLPVEEIGADHEPSATLAGLAVHHCHVGLVLVQPPADDWVRVDKKHSGSKAWLVQITPVVMMVINLFQTAGLNCNLI